MNRCHPLRATSLTLTLSLLMMAGHAQAQFLPGTTTYTYPLGQTVSIRAFHGKWEYGVLRVVSAPDVQLDSKADRLSPGARIRDTNNIVVLPGSLQNVDLPVLYRRESSGMLHEIWLLTKDEVQAYSANPAGIQH